MAGVDVRGGGPGTRETDLLDPRNLVDRIHALVFTGGSALGLAAVDGVVQRLLDGVGRLRGRRAGLGRGGPGRAGRGDLRPRPWRRVPQHSRTRAGRGGVRRGVRRGARGQPRRRRRRPRRRPQGRRRHRELDPARTARPSARWPSSTRPGRPSTSATGELFADPALPARRPASSPPARPRRAGGGQGGRRAGAGAASPPAGDHPGRRSPPTPPSPRPSARRSAASATTAWPGRSTRCTRCSTATPSSRSPPAPATRPPTPCTSTRSWSRPPTASPAPSPGPMLAAESTHGLRSYRDAFPSAFA